MPAAQLVRAALLREQRAGVLAHRLGHREAPVAPHPDQGDVHQRGERLPGVAVGHPVELLDRPRLGEHAEPREQVPLLLVKQRDGPVQRAVGAARATRAAARDRPAGIRRAAASSSASGRPSSRRHSSAIAGASAADSVKPGSARARALDEQGHGRHRLQRGRIGLAGGGDRERLERQHHLGLQPSGARPVARMRSPGAASSRRASTPAATVPLLHAVDDQQQHGARPDARRRPARARRRRPRRAPTAAAIAGTTSAAAESEREADQEHAVRELVEEPGAARERQPRLAAATGARQGEQPRVRGEAGAHLGHLAVAPDEGRERRGQVRAHRLRRARRREVGARHGSRARGGRACGPRGSP